MVVFCFTHQVSEHVKLVAHVLRKLKKYMKISFNQLVDEGHMKVAYNIYAFRGNL
jgi:hypothetical protein